MTTDQWGSLTTSSRRDHGQIDLTAAPRDAGRVRGAGHAHGDGGGHGLVEHARDDVFLAQLGASDAGGERARGRQLHVVIDRACPRVEQATEESWEAQHVVDLVRVVRAPGRHDPDVACGVFRLDLGDGVRHRKHDRIASHAFEVADAQDSWDRESDEDVGALQGIGEPALDLARIRGAGNPALHEIHPLRPVLIDRAELVHADDVTHAAGQQDLDGRRPRGAHAGHDHPQLFEVFLHDSQGVQQGRQDDDGRPVLVVVEDRHVELLAQALLDLEAARSGDVLEIDAAEARSQILHGFDDFVGVLGGQTDREGVDVREFLEQHRLAFHHGQGAFGADVAKTQHGCAVRHHGHRVLLDRQRECPLAVLLDRQTDAGNARRVGHRQIVSRADRNFAMNLDLAAQMHQKRAVGDVDDTNTRGLLQAVDDLRAVRTVARVDGDVADDALAARFDEVDGPDVAAAAAYRPCDPPG